MTFPPDRLCNWPRRVSGRGVKLNTRLYKVPGLRTSGAIPLGPHIPSWSARGQIYIFHCNVIVSSVLRSSNWPSSLSFRSKFLQYTCVLDVQPILDFYHSKHI